MFKTKAKESGKVYLSAAQQMQACEARTAHEHMKLLNEATAEAVKCHDKYLAALEKVMTCLLNSSDTWEDIRRHLGPDGVAVDATSPSASRLVASHATWKVSNELRALRDQLEELKKLSSEGCEHTKRLKTRVEKMEECAKKCAALNTPAAQAKRARCSEKKRAKLCSKQHAQYEKMASIDMTVLNDLKSTGTWWSARLVNHCDNLCHVFACLGKYTALCFADSSSPSSITVANGVGPNTYSAPPPPYMGVPTQSYYHNGAVVAL